MTPLDPASNGQRPSVHPLGCFHEDRWTEIRDDVREIKEAVKELKDCVVGSPGSTAVPIVTRLTLVERDGEESKKRWASWKQAIAAVLIAVVSPLLIWVVQIEFRDHVARPEPKAGGAAKPGLPADVLAASPSPLSVAASPEASIATQPPSPEPHPKAIVAEQ